MRKWKHERRRVWCHDKENGRDHWQRIQNRTWENGFVRRIWGKGVPRLLMSVWRSNWRSQISCWFHVLWTLEGKGLNLSLRVERSWSGVICLSISHDFSSSHQRHRTTSPSTTTHPRSYPIQYHLLDLYLTLCTRLTWSVHEIHRPRGLPPAPSTTHRLRCDFHQFSPLYLTWNFEKILKGIQWGEKHKAGGMVHGRHSPLRQGHRSAFQISFPSPSIAMVFYWFAIILSCSLLVLHQIHHDDQKPTPVQYSPQQRTLTTPLSNVAENTTTTLFTPGATIQQYSGLWPAVASNSKPGVYLEYGGCREYSARHLGVG